MSSDPDTPVDDPSEGAGLLRIGELSRRHGVSADVLRAWERRYGLLRPRRSPGGFRLYTAADDARLSAMRQGLAEGLSPAVAARRALAAARPRRAPAGPDDPEAWVDARARLAAALEGFRDREAHAVIDDLIARWSVEAVLREVVLPHLRRMGERWASGEATVAQEHFGSEVIRGRLLGLARGWDRGGGPRAVLACPSGERHDIGLICFGIGLREQGWRITFLGADTPADMIESAARAVDAALVVLSATREERFRRVREEIAALAAQRTVALGGAGATAAVADAAGAVLVQEDPLSAAGRLSRAAGRAG